MLSGVSYRHGVWHELTELTERGLAGPAEITTLTRGGLTRYSVISGPMKALHADCIAETLDETGIEPASIDAVLFFSSTFSSYDDHGDMVELCRSVGMTQALPIGIFLAQCSNFSYALMIARSLIESQGMRAVLLVGADALDESRGSRLLPASASVFSDAVLTCMVSPELTSGFLIEHCDHLVEPQLSAIDPLSDQLKFIDLFAARIQDLCVRTYSRTGRQPNDFTKLVLANLAIPVLKNYAAISGIPFSRVPTTNISKFGHCFAYDQLMTLATLTESGDIGSGDVACILGVGATYLFSSTVVRVL